MVEKPAQMTLFGVPATVTEVAADATLPPAVANGPLSAANELPAAASIVVSVPVPPTSFHCQ